MRSQHRGTRPSGPAAQHRMACRLRRARFSRWVWRLCRVVAGCDRLRRRSCWPDDGNGSRHSPGHSRHTKRIRAGRPCCDSRRQDGARALKQDNGSRSRPDASSTDQRPIAGRSSTDAGHRCRAQMLGGLDIRAQWNNVWPPGDEEPDDRPERAVRRCHRAGDALRKSV